MIGFDMTESIAPKSDQLNAEDMLAGPRTFTIDKVDAGSAEQPVNVHLVELPGRPWRPSKTSRRVLVAGWGRDASLYAGRRVTLFRDPTIKFGGQEVGGIAVSHLSHIDRPLSLALTVTRGKRAAYRVQPLADAPAVAPRPDVVKAMADAGITAKADALAYLSKVTGRTITASKELTEAEAADVVAALAAPADDKPPLGDRFYREPEPTDPALWPQTPEVQP